MATDDRFGVAASDLHGYTVRGFLDKKRPSKKLLSVKYQRRWCVLHDSTLYYFFNPSDRRQKGSFSLIGYKFWSGGTENSFSLVGSGKRTYDFICPTSEDFGKWKAGILAVTENVPSGHEVFVNKKSMHNNITSSPSTNKKTVRKKSLSRESSSDSTDNAEIPPARPPPVHRPPKRPPMPPIPKSGKPPITKKQSDPAIDVYASVNKSQLSRSNTAIPITTSNANDDLDDYDVVDNHTIQSNVKTDDLDDYDVVDKHMKQSDISTDSDDDIYDRAGDPPEPLYSFARQHSTQSVSSSDSELDYAHINPRSSDDYSSTTEIQMLRRTSSSYDKPYEIAHLKKESDFHNSDDESSYLTSADLHGPKSSNRNPTKQMESSIASLLGLNIKSEKQTISCDADLDTYVEFVAEGVKQAQVPSSSKNRSRKKRHLEESALNSVPEDPYMEFVGEGELREEEDPYMQFVGEGELGEEEEDLEDEALQSEDFFTESDIVQTKNTKNEAKQKKPLSQLHSLQLELNRKLVQRLHGTGQVTSPDKESSDSVEDEPLYENFFQINTLGTRSLPRDILPASPPLQLYKRKQPSFESNSDSSSDNESPPCVSMSH